MNETLTLDVLKAAVAGQAAAFRCATDYQPFGGAGDKVFPPTYEGGKYAVETRIIDGQSVQCVLLDSVQSQANRMELALLEALESGRMSLPVVSVKFENIPKPLRVTSLDAPHRVADAIFRDSIWSVEGKLFRLSSKGRILDVTEAGNARGLFGLCPTALVFGLWDSTGPRGGLGAKFQRALVSEMMGYHAQDGAKTSSRIDPLQITLNAGTLYEREEKSDTTPTWTLDATLAAKDKNQPRKLGKNGKPSEANHGNVTPGISVGGFTIGKAVQTTVLSLVALRRLRFPTEGAAVPDPAVDVAARTLLAGLGLAAAVLARASGADLRSRCQLFPTGPFVWELLENPGETPRQFTLDTDAAIALFNDALKEARQAGLPWEDEIALEPSPELLELVRRSQVLAAKQTGDVGGQ
jgi:CRISPR-associated protein Csb1